MRGDYKNYDLWTMRSDGSGQKRLTYTAHVSEFDPAWSPGGSRIAFAVERPASKQGIYVMDANGRHRRRLTNSDDQEPSWSPDGRSIAFTRYSGVSNSGSWNLFVIRLSDGSVGNLSNDPTASDVQPDWSPNGKRIIFASDRGNAPEGPDQTDLWSMNADGTGLRRVTDTPDFSESDPAWSPNGQWIVYGGAGASGGASSQIYISRPNGANRHAITHSAIANEQPSWQPAQTFVSPL